MNTKITIVLLLYFAVVACTPHKELVDNTQQFDIMLSPIGHVDFPNSCSAKVAPLIERAVALLHHMMYTEADFLFSSALAEDKNCAIAMWGRAMSIIHPLWPDKPSEQEIKEGANLTEKALSVKNRTERETAYLMSTLAYFIEANTTAKRLTKFESAWKKISEQFPQDQDAKAFYALAHIATADKTDQAYKQYQAAAKIAQEVLYANPQHPGAHHYIIHAFDVPGHAHKATDVVRSYATIAPKVPHAAHMMSHIYTRLGDWERSIKWNKISSETAWDMCVSSGEINSHYTHALDYLAYAYLQMANDNAVNNLIDDLAKLEAPYSEINHASAYALAAIPARFAAEQQDWDSATKLQARMPLDFPWDESHDPYVAITHFVKAIGLARTGKTVEANQEIVKLGKLQTKIAAKNDYWALQVNIQVLASKAWLLYAQQHKEDGLARMSEAAALELSTQKHPITPGAIIPANELYGDMLMQEGLYMQAVESYKASLARNPKRLNTLIGLSNAYIKLGDTEAVKRIYTKIEAQLEQTTTSRESISTIASYIKSVS